MLPPLTRLGLMTAAVLVALAAPAAAQAGFSEDLVPVSEVFTNSGGDAVAVDASGDAIVAWTSAPNSMEKRTLKARRIKADGTLGPVLALSDGTLVASAPEVAFAGNGRAVVTWTEIVPPGANSALEARVIGPDDSLGDIRPVRVA